MWKYVKRIIRNVVRYVRFFGVRYYCVLCGGHTRNFTPITAYPGQKTIDKYQIVAMGINPHYRCPWCNSSDKERLVWKYLITHTDITTTAQEIAVLHVAPEKNTKKRLRARPNIRYVAGDMFKGAPKYTPEHYDGAMYLDITDMSQFSDNKFDLIICNHVLEHVLDDRKGMQEIYRTLKKGGIAILQVPVSRIIEQSVENRDAITEDQRTEQFGQSDHVRIYAENDYLSRLKSMGFFVEVIPCTALFSPKDANFWGVNLRESVYIGRKK